MWKGWETLVQVQQMTFSVLTALLDGGSRLGPDATLDGLLGEQGEQKIREVPVLQQRAFVIGRPTTKVNSRTLKLADLSYGEGRMQIIIEFPDRSDGVLLDHWS